MNDVLTSASNPTVKYIKKLLTSGKARSDENTYVAEGIHLVSSFLAAGRTPLLYACAVSALQNDEVKELVRGLDSQGVKQVVMADSLFESLSAIHASVGIVLLFSPEVSGDLGSLQSDAVLLEDVQDPGNLGTILRTAAAAGVKTAILSPQCASPWSPKALRAGMGAQFSLAIYEDKDLATVISDAKIPVLATVLASDSVSLYGLDLTNPAVWLVGNEGQGVSEALVGLATTKVHIPQSESAVESLNVAAATAVCLYEQYRQRIAT